MTNTVLNDVYSYSLEDATKMKQLPLFPYNFMYPTTLIYLMGFYYSLLKISESFGFYSASE